MSFAELLPEVVSLPHAEKFQLVQFLLEQLAKQKGIALSVSTFSDALKTVGGSYHSGRRVDNSSINLSNLANGCNRFVDTNKTI
ncbi:hypothetical protein [Thiothrix unzii]|jgi:hypothetical protein|uniref:hypothetical protein n=1 Tax=Thiothrix unzii TaxID=111769 RepID=UPI002A37183C|nr:hypothetical protein [Thiothrix unzii]MDX9990180.1 hypothetical protein [Thiothrix unzii]